MSNSYYKVLNSKITSNQESKFINDLHSELRNSIKKDDNDLYTMLADFGKGYKSKNLDINLLLKYYLLNQIIESTKETVYNKDNGYIDTPNPNIKTNKDGKFFKISDNSVKEDKSIISVDSNGSYTIEEKNCYKLINIIKVIDINDIVISIQVKDNRGNIIRNRELASELVGLRREYKKKYKYSGYSGNSRDMVTHVKNLLSMPIETGYFMDFHCSYYKWLPSTSAFVRMFDRDSESPLLVDIEFQDNGTVLRQEYTGICA